MTLGSIFSKEGLKQDYLSLFKETQSRTVSNMYSNGSTIRNKPLEDLLNGLFYSNDSAGLAEYNRVMQNLGNNTQERMKELIDSVEISDSGQVSFSGLENFNMSNSRLSLDTAKSIVGKAQKIINNLSTNKDLQHFENTFIEIVNELNETISGLSDKNGLITIASDKVNFKNFRSKLYLIEKLASALEGWPNVNALGEALEQGITASFLGAINAGYKDLAHAFKVGSSSTTRTWSSGGVKLNFTLDLSGLKDILGEKIPEHMNHFKAEEKNFIISASPQGSTSMKTDVLIGLQDGSAMGLSLKNWGSIFSNVGFGQTTIFNALVRSGGKSGIEHYSGNILLDNASMAHQFARLCIAADILMGIGQETGWASHLVINDRSQSYIYVFNMAPLIASLEKEVSMIKIEGYEENYLHEAAWKILRNVKHRSPGRTDTYLSMMYGLLHAKIVTVKFSTALLSGLSK
jgi:hypothetical protein